MNLKKDLYNLHCRVKHSTADVLKQQSEELGVSVGEVVDVIVESYLEFCHTQDQWLEETDIYGQLSQLNEKLDKIGQKIGVE